MIRHLTYTEYLGQKVFKISTPLSQTVYKLVVITLANIFLILSSKINFVLPFTPVPFTMQTFTALFLSMLLGRKIVYALLLYIFEGMLGLPVFAKGGGVLYLLGPTGGYILGFLVAGYLCGKLAEEGFDKNFIKTLFAMFVGHLIIYFFGVLWLLRFFNFNLYKTVTVGVIPFVISDFLKIIVASIVLPVCYKKLN